MQQDNERKHLWEAFMDNVWLLFILGVLIPFLSYSAWGWIDMMSVPQAVLP